MKSYRYVSVLFCLSLYPFIYTLFVLCSDKNPFPQASNLQVMEKKKGTWRKEVWGWPRWILVHFHRGKVMYLPWNHLRLRFAVHCFWVVMLFSPPFRFGCFFSLFHFLFTNSTLISFFLQCLCPKGKTFCPFEPLPTGWQQLTNSCLPLLPFHQIMVPHEPF